MLSIKMTFLLLRFGALKRKPESARPMDAATMNKVLDYAVGDKRVAGSSRST